MPAKTNKSPAERSRILGIDPGTNVLGYALIETHRQEFTVLALDILQMPRNFTHHQKLERIFRELSGLITHYQPEAMAVEAPFFGKNVQSMLKLGRAQGVAIAAGMNAGLQVAEYSPRKIKQSVTGRGNAGKEQVAAMLRHLSGQSFGEVPLDATDALATAVCHLYQSRQKALGGKQYKNWSAFLKDNPDRKV